MLQALRPEVQALASPERAKTNAWFFKTGPGQYGEGEQFAGLTLTQIRGLVRKYRDLSIDDSETLLLAPARKRLLALLILVQRTKPGDG
jgi:hypothetical protein